MNRARTLLALGLIALTALPAQAGIYGASPTPVVITTSAPSGEVTVELTRPTCTLCRFSIVLRTLVGDDGS